MLSDAEAAYIAGIIDGEGSILLTRNRQDRYPSPQVSVTSTDHELLDWLCKRLRGSIVRNPFASLRVEAHRPPCAETTPTRAAISRYRTQDSTC